MKPSEAQTALDPQEDTGRLPVNQQLPDFLYH